MENPSYTAVKTRIEDILGGTFSAGSREDFKPSYVVDKFGRKMYRVNIIGTIMDKFSSPDGRYTTVTVDDGSGVMRAKLFGEDASLFSGFNVGDEVVVVGKPKRYNEEIYVSPESVKRVADFNYVTLRRLEILKDILKFRRLANNVREIASKDGLDAAKAYAVETMGIGEESVNAMVAMRDDKRASAEDVVVNIIKNSGKGDGVELKKILEESRLSEAEIDSVMTKLLDDGLIFEPHIGRFKFVG